jgi:type VI secretion system secreted protein Hcp
MRFRRLVLMFALLVAVPMFAADTKTSKDGAGSIVFDGKSIDVLSWSFGVSQSASTSGGGGGAGKVTFKDFTFTKKIDKSSSALFLACASGQHIPQVVLSVVDDKGSPIGTVSFQDVIVSDFTTSASGGDAPSESISLNYTKIEIKY